MYSAATVEEEREGGEVGSAGETSAAKDNFVEHKTIDKINAKNEKTTLSFELWRNEYCPVDVVDY